ncbi:hypothetical protein CFC21_093445 [Triticum aestivum]|uniref:Knottin scorpion toxin-like domain-containing protein n=2 Tax=Triticum aestivum TaxID=4565 RepID=A0A3B6QHF6_WHEAT|nr:hypothetical protein CFC21_093445 [Triticum aestivum]
MRSTQILFLAFAFLMLSSAMATSKPVCNHILKKGHCNNNDCRAYCKKFIPPPGGPSPKYIPEGCQCYTIIGFQNDIISNPVSIIISRSKI